MKFFRLHVFQKGKGWKKRRRAKSKKLGGYNQMMLHLDREGTVREDWMSNGLERLHHAERVCDVVASGCNVDVQTICVRDTLSVRV